MSTYGNRVNDEWKASHLYKQPNLAFQDSLHPILHSQIIDERTADLEKKAIEAFKVTRLPRGGIHEADFFYPSFKDENLRKVRGSKSKTTTREQLVKEAEEQWKAKERKLESKVTKEESTLFSEEDF